MDKKALALHLIKQDLKYHQFAAGLKAVGIDVEFYPDLVRVIRSLMDYDSPDAPDAWVHVYVKGLDKASSVAWGDEVGLYLIANAMYQSLNTMK